MKQKPYKKALYNLWDEFWNETDEKAEKLGLVLQNYLATIENPDAEDYYLWGQSIYSLNQERVLENSHPYFIKSLSLDNEYYLSRLYSAHCFHDKGEFQNALENYLLVDQKLLREQMPMWRWVKLLEQIGFCYCKINKLPKALHYFEKVIKSYEIFEKDELVFIQEAYESLPNHHPLVARLKRVEDKHFT